MTFANPSYFFLFLVFIPVILWYIWKQKGAQASMQVSATGAFRRMKQSYKSWFRHVNFAILLLSLAFKIGRAPCRERVPPPV